MPLQAAAVNLIRAFPWMMISLLHRVTSVVMLVYFAFGGVHCHAAV
jgi:hypothetical protein